MVESIHIDDVVNPTHDVKFLLKDPIFSGIHGRLSGVGLYDSYIRLAQEHIEKTKSQQIKVAYERAIEIARALRAIEEQREPLTYPSDAEPRMRYDEAGAHIVNGDGSYITLSDHGENKYHPAER